MLFSLPGLAWMISAFQHVSFSALDWMISAFQYFSV
jgi:hypothetical protein